MCAGGRQPLLATPATLPALNCPLLQQAACLHPHHQGPVLHTSPCCTPCAVSALHPSHSSPPLNLLLPHPLSSRHQLDSSYKASRRHAPDDFHQDLAHLKQLLTALNVPHLSMEGYEADDVMGTLATSAARQGWQVRGSGCPCCSSPACQLHHAVTAVPPAAAPGPRGKPDVAHLTWRT